MTPRASHEMTDEELRIKVAELCGWKRREVFEPSFADPSKLVSRGRKWHNPINDLPQRLPDYPNDLNAMHEAEKALTDDEHSRFSDHLGSILCDGKYYHWSDGGAMRGFVSATAHQRAEAFVKTLTK